MSQEKRIHMTSDTYKKIAIVSMLTDRTIKSIVAEAIEEWVDINGYKNKVATINRMREKERRIR